MQILHSNAVLAKNLLSQKFHIKTKNLKDEISVSGTKGLDDFHKSVFSYCQIICIIVHIMLYSCLPGNQ